jgi:prepilin-type N-terminal cleavage/methylation domain-containing protein
MNRSRNRRQQGFTLIETMIAMVVLAFGILSLSAIFTQGVQTSYNSQIDFIAQQKAQQALESIFTARDTHILTWEQITNVSQGGVFVDGPQPMYGPGLDGIVGTADDDPKTPDTIVTGPGPDKVFGTADDIQVNLNPWMKRTIAFIPVKGTPNLNQITVTITYTYEGRTSNFVLTTYISNYA